MGVWRKAVAAVAIAVGVAVTLAGGSAQAQTAPPPPPVFSVVDDNGVDLASGRFNVARTEATVGPVGSGGLAHVNQGAWLRTSNFGGIAADMEQVFYTVSIGNASAKFKKEASGAFTPQAGAIGQTLTYDAPSGIYTHTSNDGTAATFASALSQVFPVKADAGLITAITKPDGEKLTYHYSDFDASCSTPCKRLDAVTSNLGYMLKYDYATGAYPANLSLLKVTAINLGHDYCAPGPAACTLTNTWSSVTYTYPASEFPYTTTVATDSLGRQTTYKSFPPFGSFTLEANLVSRITDPSGVVTDIAYNLQNKVQSVTTAAGTWTYSYADLGGGTTQTTVTDPLSHTRSVVVNSDGQVLSATDGAGQTTTFTVDAPTGLVTRVTQPEGNYTEYGYDGRGNVTSLTRVAKPGSGLPNHVTQAVYPASCTNPKTCNKPTSVTEGGATTDFTYDANHGGVLTVTEPAGATGVRPQTRITYSSYGATFKNASGAFVASPDQVVRARLFLSCTTQTTCTNGADEKRISHYFGSSGTAANNLQVVHTTVSEGSTTLARLFTLTYTKQGDLSVVNGPASTFTDNVSYRYNSERQLIGELGIDPSATQRAVARKFQYRPDGQVDWVESGTVASHSDSGWNGFIADERVTLGYDAAGRKVSETLTAGGVARALTQYSYDAASRLDCVAVRMNAAAFGSPPSSACTLGTPGPDGPDRITRYGYDAADRQVTVTSAYDTADARVDVATTYRPNGQVETVADAKGNLTTYEYDGFDRLKKTRFPSPTVALVSSTTDYTELTYNNATWTVSQDRRRDGTVVTYGYDARGNITSKSAPSASYSYDNFNRQRTATEGGQTLTTVYDALDRVKSQTGPLGAVTYEYDVSSRRTRMTWPDSFYVTYEYDFSGAVTAIKENGATALATFTYDNQGRRTSLTRANGVVTSYGYDPVSRLQTLTQNLTGTDRDQTLTFGHTAASQIKTRTSTNPAYAWNGLYNVSRSYGVNGLNQVTSSGGQAITHDPRGNLQSDGVSSYSYDVDNRLTGTGAGAALVYDPGSRLYQTTSSGGTVTRFAYDGADMIGEYNSANVLQRRYVHGPGVDEPLVWYEGSGTADRRFLVADQQGSIVAITDGTGTATTVDTYDDYGIPGAGNLGRFQYTGQAWIPELGLYHYKARAYSPTLGRFLQTDPIGYGDGMNMYAYVGNDPVNFGDAFGLSRSGCQDPDPNVIIVCGMPPVSMSDAMVRLGHFLSQEFLKSLRGIAATAAPKAKDASENCPKAPAASAKGLHPKAQAKADALIAALARAGIQARVGSGSRTFAQQNQLYAQGRNGNPGPVVTYARGGQSNHNYSVAFDVNIYRNGAYVTNGRDPLYTQAGAIGESLGLQWGGRWKRYDAPHFQYMNGNTEDQVRARYKDGKDVYCGK